MRLITLVTDRKVVPGGDLVDAVTRALAALPPGSAHVQLREKDLDGAALLSLARALATICHEYDARLLVNDRVDVARAAGADGVHLGRRSFTPAEARAIWPEAIVGVSCHSPFEVAEAKRDGADFAILGPIFETPSKIALGLPPVGLPALEAARQRVGPSFQIFAIGGLDPGLVPRALEAGASGVAVIRAVFADLDPGGAAAALWRGLGCKPST